MPSVHSFRRSYLRTKDITNKRIGEVEDGMSTGIILALVLPRWVVAHPWSMVIQWYIWLCIHRPSAWSSCATSCTTVDGHLKSAYHRSHQSTSEGLMAASFPWYRRFRDVMTLLWIWREETIQRPWGTSQRKYRSVYTSEISSILQDFLTHWICSSKERSTIRDRLQSADPLLAPKRSHWGSSHTRSHARWKPS